MKQTKPNKTPKAKSTYDQAIYNETKSLLDHGYFSQIAKKYRQDGQTVRRIMLGYYNKSDGTHKAIREEILSKAAAVKVEKTREAKRLGLVLQS